MQRLRQQVARLSLQLAPTGPSAWGAGAPACGPHVATASKQFVSLASLACKQLPARSRHWTGGKNLASSAITQFQREFRQQYGIATRFVRSAGAAGPRGLGAAPRLASRAGLGRRPKSTLASAPPRPPLASDAYGPAALTAGLTAGQRRALAWWLGGSSAWVFSLVLLGGVTRLTRSGLSMTDWKLTGERPPSTQAEWAAEFARYQQSPEYLRVNRGMGLEEFKFIFWMEWAHRMWGRALGLVWALPAAYFGARGLVNAPLARRLALLFCMGGTQRLVGWWMVRSGLEEPEGHGVPRVSPYRLAAHLTSAFAIYATLVWTTLSVAAPSMAEAALAGLAGGGAAAAALLRSARPLAALVGVTAVSGAFVAGLDAGHAYNTFPTMGGRWIPEEYWAVPGWRNAFESTAAVQLHHRALALTTLGAVTALWLQGRALPALPRTPRRLLAAVALAAGAQVALGITTLLTYVPVELGSAHQAGALTLFTLVLALLYSLRTAPRPDLIPALAARWTTPAAAAAVLGIGGVVTQLQ